MSFADNGPVDMEIGKAEGAELLERGEKLVNLLDCGNDKISSLLTSVGYLEKVEA